MAFDAADFRFDFGDRAYVRARLLSAAAQERVDVCGVVSANLVAGEDDQIGVRFLMAASMRRIVSSRTFGPS